MRRALFACTCLALLLLTPGAVRSGEEPPRGSDIPGDIKNHMLSYMQLSHDVLDALDALFAIDDKDPRTQSETLWEDTCADAYTKRRAYLSSLYTMYKAKGGRKALPKSVQDWLVEDDARWTTVKSAGGTVFTKRTFMAQFVYDLTRCDAPSWYKKEVKIHELGEEVDKEYVRLTKLAENLGSLSKSELQNEQRNALQMVHVVGALTGKCRDLEKDMSGWLISRTKPETLKQFYDDALNNLPFDKESTPTFFAHREKWRELLDAWNKQYASLLRDFGAAIERFAKEKGVFAKHGKCLEDLTFDEIDDKIGNEFRSIYNAITIEISSR